MRISRLGSKCCPVPIALKRTIDEDELEEGALLDSGAENCYVHSAYVDEHQLLPSILPHPIGVYNADGSLNSNGSITHFVDLIVRKEDHTELLRFYVTNLGSVDLILGHSWLKYHNPDVDWRKSVVSMTRCPLECGHSVPSCAHMASCTPNPGSDSGADSDELPAETPPTLDEYLEQARLEMEEAFRDELHKDDHLLLIHLDDSFVIRRIGELETSQRSAARGKSKLPYPQCYLEDFSPVFSDRHFDTLPPSRPYDHPIELKPNAAPFSSKVYNLSKEERRKLDDFIDEELRTGRIRPSSSPFASPFFFVKKKDGSLRPVQDYRKLNEVTIRNRYPLPLISDLMDQLKNAMYFTKLDVRQGFNNVRIRSGDEHKAAFITSRGLFEPTVMFFGLCNSPATFQNMMNDIFRELIMKGGVIIYMDDILIFHSDLDEHERVVREVLQLLEDNHLCLKESKCVWHAKEVEYLGVIVSQGSVRMDPKKVEAVTSWPTPNNKKRLQQFLGFVNFYRRFIKGFSTHAAPLHRLTGKTCFWEWTEEHQTAFDKLKSLVTDDVTLALPLDDAPFRVETDASLFASGGVLSQLQDGLWRPVAFLSKSFSPAEQNYEVHDRELLAIIRGLCEWRHYLHSVDKPFNILSDHANLQYFFKAQRLNPRQARWTQVLSEFNFELHHRPGTSMIVSDALSRRPDWDDGCEDSPPVTVLKAHHLRTLASATRNANAFLDTIRSHNAVLLDTWNEKRNLPGWAFKDSTLTWHGRVFVPDVDDLRERVLQENHDSPMAGHPGRSRTNELIQRDFWWPSLTRDCNAYVDACAICQRTKPLRSKPVGTLMPNESPTDTWSVISADFITKLPKSKGFDSVFVVVDRLSKMVRVVPCKEKGLNAEKLARLFRDNVWSLFGLPAKVISDRGSAFVSEFTKALNELLGIAGSPSTSYRPQADGQTERVNQEVEQFLRIFCNERQSDWAEWLPCAEFALNNKISSATGLSPFFIKFGKHQARPLAPVREPESRVPAAAEFGKRMAELRREVSASLDLAAQAMKRSYDKHRCAIVPFTKGDKVWVDATHFDQGRPSKKLSDKRIGPYLITEVISPRLYRIGLPETFRHSRVFNIDRLVRFREPRYPSQSSQESPLVHIKITPPRLTGIHAHKMTRSSLFLLVSLDGSDDPVDRVWEDAALLHDPDGLIPAYRTENQIPQAQVAEN